MSDSNKFPKVGASERKQLLIERVFGGDPVPIEDWLEIYVHRIDERTIAIGGYHRPDGGYRSELTFACWTDWEEAKEIGRTLSALASTSRLLFNRPQCFLVIEEDA